MPATKDTGRLHVVEGSPGMARVADLTLGRENRTYIVTDIRSGLEVGDYIVEVRERGAGRVVVSIAGIGQRVLIVSDPKNTISCPYQTPSPYRKS